MYKLNVFLIIQGGSLLLLFTFALLLLVLFLLLVFLLLLLLLKHSRKLDNKNKIRANLWTLILTFFSTFSVSFPSSLKACKEKPNQYKCCIRDCPAHCLGDSDLSKLTDNPDIRLEKLALSYLFLLLCLWLVFRLLFSLSFWSS